MTKQNNININMSWDKEVIAAEQKSERSLLIDLIGEGDLKTKHKERPPVNLAIVIDCSGSMEGPPIEAAKSAAKQITEKLTQKEIEDEITNLKRDPNDRWMIPIAINMMGEKQFPKHSKNYMEKIDKLRKVR